MRHHPTPSVWLLGGAALLTASACKQPACELDPQQPACASIKVHSRRLARSGDTLQIGVPAELDGQPRVELQAPGGPAIALLQTPVLRADLLQIEVGAAELAPLPSGPLSVRVLLGEQRSTGTVELWAGAPTWLTPLELPSDPCNIRPPSWMGVPSTWVGVPSGGRGVYLPGTNATLQRCDLSMRRWTKPVSVSLDFTQYNPGSESVQCADLKAGPVCQGQTNHRFVACDPALQGCKPLDLQGAPTAPGTLSGDPEGDVLAVSTTSTVSAWAVPLARPADRAALAPLQGLGAVTAVAFAGSADLDRDGRSDLVLVGPAQVTSVYLRSGPQGLARDDQRSNAATAALHQMLGDQPPSAFQVTDFDGDGRPDLVVVTAPGRLRFAAGLADGGFYYYDKQQVEVALAQAPVLRSADVDGDGAPDLLGVVSSNGAARVQLFLRQPE